MSLLEHKPEMAQLVRVLPECPGVYQYFDDQGVIIYVGKAKNLKRRVSSYFVKEQQGKVKALVAKIADIHHIVVDTEYDALLLENNLIKEYQPRYNILLKDDKTYPCICIKNERFPRIEATRQRVRDGSQYFGPYGSVRMMHAILDMIRKLFPIRTCRLDLSPEAIDKGRYKPCMEYQIKKCQAPCVGLQSEADYQWNIQQIQHLLKGHLNTIIKELKTLMMSHAEAMRFEQAHQVKEKIALIEQYQSRSTVFSHTLKDVDVYAISRDEPNVYVIYFKVVDGAIVQTLMQEFRPKLEEDDSEILSLVIPLIRERMRSEAKEIVVPIALDITLPGVSIQTPKIGEKRALIEFAERNLKYSILEKHKRRDLVDPERHSKRVLAKMKTDLGLNREPFHMECFDNSNIQGDYPVAAMTVFKNAKPSKKDYRHFNIRTVVGPNDYASMEEILTRRYKRLIDEGGSLPDLIVVDGGKGQLGIAVKVMHTLGLSESVQLLGIAERLEEIYRPGDPFPLHIDKKSETLKILQQIRDEAHRFGITHYRKKHEKGLIRTRLTDIKGIGPQAALSLLTHFKSVARIEQASQEDIAQVIGVAKARLVFEALRATANSPKPQRQDDTTDDQVGVISE